MSRIPWIVFLAFATPLSHARLERAICGTHRDTWKEELHLHRQARQKLAGRAAAVSRPARADIGNIAILEDSDGVVARRNEFNLDLKSIRFTPSDPAASRYRFAAAGDTFDQAAAAAGQPLDLNDDDSRLRPLPFSFSFFGKTYQEVFVNSDGNLTFTSGDSASSERSLGRIVAGPPRIAPLFMDLDPSRARDSVRVLAEAGRFVVTWIGVPEYQDFGLGAPQTMQVRLYPDGRIELAYNGVNTSGAVVGIAPGSLMGSTSVLSFLAGGAQEFSAAVLERFGGSEEIDVATAAQKFYETHDDSYDYLVFFNNLGLGALSGAVAFESTVRNSRGGYGDPPVDVGREYGSPSRLQAVMNMGHLGQYPLDPNAFVPARRLSRDTTLTIIGHEAGHLFLAYASIRDPANPRARPMLGFQNAHWAFTFNSEASLLEGNRIRDNGPGTTPRFSTVAAAEGYAPLDQYLMGFRAPEEVPPTFLVAGAGASFAFRQPQPGVDFDGERQDIRVEQVIEAEGRRTPDSTVSQRRYRFAFLLVVRQGSQPSQADLDQIETYRREFEAFYRRASSDRAAADTALRLALRMSVFPAAGVVAGRSAQATLSLQRPASAPVSVALSSRNGLVSAPGSVTIPGGQSSASFSITGVRGGVDEISAVPADTRYDSASARIQVAPDLQALSLTLESGGGQRPAGDGPLPDPVVLRVTDVNRLPYPGVRVQAVTVPMGSVEPALAASDAEGRVSFRWTPGANPDNFLRVFLEGAPQSAVNVASLNSRILGEAINAASYTPVLAPGMLATLFGTNLTGGVPATADFPWPPSLGGVEITLGGQPASILYVSDTQINFLTPDVAPAAQAPLVINTASSASRTAMVRIAPVSPGIFYNAASGFGAILNAGTAETTSASPAPRGGFVEIYCTGLGALKDRETALAPAVTIGGAPAQVVYSGLASGYTGLYQVNVQVPADAPSGPQVLTLEIG
ncbi:MAG: hypothetical protein HYR60_12170, partial [Acidobacteria bacterium]|nr:hypothetical protein [Acidobacteriota bacterium]